MGYDAESTFIYVGLARLPQPSVAAGSTIAVELEIETRTRRIISVNTSLQFPGLERMLREILVGEAVENGAQQALLELDVRYSAPFSSALRAAVQGAMRRATTGGPEPDQVPVQPAALPSN